MEDRNGREHRGKGEGGGQFTSTDGAGGTHEPTEAEKERLNHMGLSEVGTKKKMTPAEKIASVHIDFDKDNILPELNEEELKKVGSKINKPILLKKSVIERNITRHNDAMPDTEEILKNVLYSPSEIFKGNDDKPYFTFVKPMRVSTRNGKAEYGLALLDVDEKKDNFEIVHWHWINEENLRKTKK